MEASPDGRGSRLRAAAADFDGEAFRRFGRAPVASGFHALGRADGAAADMRQLSDALLAAREGTGEVRAALLRAAFRPRLPGLTKLVSRLTKDGAWRKGLELYEAAAEAGLAPDTALTNAAISACDRGGAWARALEIFEGMGGAATPRDAITYSAAISALAKGKQWRPALAVFDHMRAAGVPPDVVACCSLINALERGGQWQLAEALFLEMCTDAGGGAGLAAAAAEAEAATAGGDALARAQTSPSSVLGAPASPTERRGGRGAGAAADGLERLPEDLSSAFEAVALEGAAPKVVPPPPPPAARPKRGGSLRSEASAPLQAGAAQRLRRAVSCHPRLDGFGGDGPAPFGLGGPSFSHAARVAPNRVCCNALLAAYARTRPDAQWERALRLLAAMEGGGAALRPDVVSYNTAIRACLAGSQLGRALGLLRGMRAAGVAPNAATLSQLLAAAAGAGAGAALDELAAALDAAPPDVRAPCTGALVAGLAGAGRWEEALARLRAASGLSGSGPAAWAALPPPPPAYLQLMSAAAAAGRLDLVPELFASLSASGQAVPLAAHNALLAAHAARGEWREALRALHALRGARGAAPNAASYNAALAALAAGARASPPAQRPAVAAAALAVFAELASAPGASPDAAAYCDLIAALAAAGEGGHVLAAHDAMLEAGLTPDPAAARAVLAAALGAGARAAPRAALLAASLAAQGAALGGAEARAAARAAAAAGAYDAAARLCAAVCGACGAAAAAPLFNAVLAEASAAGHFEVAVELLACMRGAGVEVAACASPPAATDGSGVASPFDAGAFLARSRSMDGGGDAFPAASMGSLSPPFARPPPPGEPAAPGAGGAAYVAAIEAAVRGGDPHAAVALCSEAHDVGALACFSLPPAAAAAVGWGVESEDGGLPGDVDLRGLGVEAGVAVLLTWLARLAQLRAAGGLAVAARVARVAAGGPALRDALLAVLAAPGGCALPGFCGLASVALPPGAVRLAADEPSGCTLEIQTDAIYAALPA